MTVQNSWDPKTQEECSHQLVTSLLGAHRKDGRQNLPQWGGPGAREWENRSLLSMEQLG